VAYVPDRGDLVWLAFDPPAGHEQSGRRPALVISPKLYNARTNLAIVCPVTSKRKGYPFEVPLPPDIPVHGVVLADQVRSLDWRARRAEFIAQTPTQVMEEVVGKLLALVAG